jgi:hypothetical protein
MKKLNKQYSVRMRLFLVCVIGFSTSLLVSSRVLRADGCRDLFQYTLQIDFNNKTLTKLYQHKEPKKICGELPVSGFENIKLELRDGHGVLIFRKPVLLQSYSNFDALAVGKDKKKHISGGISKKTSAFLITSLPFLNKGDEIELIDISSEITLAHGAP